MIKKKCEHTSSIYSFFEKNMSFREQIAQKWFNLQVKLKYNLITINNVETEKAYKMHISGP